MRSVTALLFLALAQVCFAQIITDVQVGPELDIKAMRKALNIPLIGSGQKGFTQSIVFDTKLKRTYGGFGFNKKAYNIAIFENYIAFSGGRTLSFENADESNGNLVAFVTNKANNKLYLLYSVAFKERDEFTLYANEVSSDMVVLGSPIILQSYKNLKRDGYGLTAFVRNDMVVAARMRVKDLDENPVIELKGMDNSFGEVWKKEVNLGAPARELSNFAHDIDNVGNYYLYAAQKDKQDILFSYIVKTGSLTRHPIGPADGKNFGQRLSLINGTTPVVAGLNVKDKKTITCYISTFDPSAEKISMNNVVPMPADFYETANYRGMETAAWYISALVGLDNKNVVALVDGAMGVERNGIHVANITYHSYLFGFQPDGKVQWQRKIFKMQQAMPGFTGFNVKTSGNTVIMISNDHPDNLSKKLTDEKLEMFAGYKASMVMVHEVDEAGQVKKYPLTKDKGLENMMINIEDISKVEGNLHLVPAAGTNPFDPQARMVTFRIN